MSDADLVIDLKGLLCPIPVVKIAKAIKTVEVGQIVEAEASDPGVLADIPSWCKSTGNEMLSMEKDDNKIFTFRVKRVA
jgi:tRNA 2-thiouridine synthesizing protein A